MLLKIFATLIVCMIPFCTNGQTCFIQKDPLQVLDCVTISPNIIANFISDKQAKEFCKMATSYLTCMRNYVIDCPAGHTGVGLLDDLVDLTKKCCIIDKIYRNETDLSTNTTQLIQINDQCLITNKELTKNCFSLDNKIQLSNGNTMRIGDIRVGDCVKTLDTNGNLIDTKIVSILHKETNEYAKFIQLQTIFLNEDDNGPHIELTDTHLIHIKSKGFIKASQVKVNDILIDSYKRELIINKIDVIIKKGYIAPMSEHGTLLVNSIYTSCYAQVNSHSMAHFIMTPLIYWYRLKEYYQVMMTSLSNHTNTFDDTNNGINAYASLLYHLTNLFMPSLIK